jgi:hypothetical protein
MRKRSPVSSRAWFFLSKCAKPCSKVRVKPSTGLDREPEMERFTYRGYQIEPRREWSNWCVIVYPTRADLPMLPQSTLHTLTSRKDQAVEEARHRIDRALSNLRLG